MPAASTSRAAVVGGGPAGLMAAEVLAVSGCAVTVYEHKRSAGRKFLLAGRGGLNITHSEPSESFRSRYGDAPQLLVQALDSFGPAELREWCTQLGQPTFVGSSGRVFPEAFRATPLLRAWLSRLAGLGVELKTQHRWVGFGPQGTLEFHDAQGEQVAVESDVSVLALGGASWPRVGSDGSWVEPFAKAGVDVAPLQPANCGLEVRWHPPFAEKFHGQPLKNLAVTMGEHTVRGDCTITRLGLEGGPVYAHSAAARTQIATTGNATLHLDLQPDLTVGQLAKRLAKRRPKDSASTWLRGAGFSPAQVGVLREATANQIPQDREDAAALIKRASLQASALMPIDRAISTAGGVYAHELDEHFMLSKLPGVFVAGEMLDWEAPTGGYLLQACFSTGLVAGQGALRFLNDGNR